MNKFFFYSFECKSCVDAIKFIVVHDLTLPPYLYLINLRVEKEYHLPH